jgi:hypothetical protein
MQSLALPKITHLLIKSKGENLYWHQEKYKRVNATAPKHISIPTMTVHGMAAWHGAAC